MPTMKFFDHPVPRYPLTSSSDYRAFAKKRLPRQLFDFLDGGAFDEVTILENREDFQRVRLKRRVLRDVSDIDTSTEIFGQKLAFPLILAPVGFAGCFARRGEAQAARAAAQAGIPFSLSQVGICSMEEVSEAAGSPCWVELNLLKDRKQTLEQMERAKAIGCPVLFLTVDLPVVGARYRYNRSRRTNALTNFWEALTHLPWWVDVRLRGGPFVTGNFLDLPSMRRWVGSQTDRTFSWKEFEWVRKNWPGKVMIKGILDPEDAKMAHEVGADGIVVSNHGARHMDGTLSTIAALPAISAAVGGKLEILIDGGITSGLDIVRALALGADTCMIGKPWVYGLAARGEKGVSEVLGIFQSELKIAMAHLGVSSIGEINRGMVHDLINKGGE